jgi:hypothetical protein
MVEESIALHELQYRPQQLQKDREGTTFLPYGDDQKMTFRSVAGIHQGAMCIEALFKLEDGEYEDMTGAGLKAMMQTLSGVYENIIQTLIEERQRYHDKGIKTFIGVSFNPAKRETETNALNNGRAKIYQYFGQKLLGGAAFTVEHVNDHTAFFRTNHPIRLDRENFYADLVGWPHAETIIKKYYSIKPFANLSEIWQEALAETNHFDAEELRQHPNAVLVFDKNTQKFVDYYL